MEALNYDDNAKAGTQADSMSVLLAKMDKIEAELEGIKGGKKTEGTVKPESFKENWGENVLGFGFGQIPKLLFIAQDLNLPQRLVLSLLITYKDQQYLTDEKMSRMLGINPVQISKTLKVLEDKGWIKRERMMHPTMGYRRRKINLEPARVKLEAMARDPKTCDILTKL